jgi:hypothetical protein
MNLTAMLLGDCDNIGFALSIAFMHCDLANRRNASRRRSWLLPGCAADELRGLEEGMFHHDSALERYDLANREMPHDNAGGFCVTGSADGFRFGNGGKVLVGSLSPKCRHACFRSRLICEIRADTCVHGRGGVDHWSYYDALDIEYNTPFSRELLYDYISSCIDYGLSCPEELK